MCSDYFGVAVEQPLALPVDIRSLPPISGAAWKAIFEYLVFQSEGTALEHLPPSVKSLSES